MCGPKKETCKTTGSSQVGASSWEGHLEDQASGWPGVFRIIRYVGERILKRNFLKPRRRFSWQKNLLKGISLGVILILRDCAFITAALTATFGHNPDRLDDTCLGVRYLIFVYFVFFVFLSDYLKEKEVQIIVWFFSCWTWSDLSKLIKVEVVGGTSWDLNDCFEYPSIILKSSRIIESTISSPVNSFISFAKWILDLKCGE